MAEDYSIITGQKKNFSIVDYVLFGLTLAISAAIGLFYAIKDRNQINSRTYLLGERKMYVLPVALSLMVTFLSALTLLGHPAEMYNFNTMFWWIGLAQLFAMVIVARVFVPFFYTLNVTSVFQYLEMRFNKPVRVLASLCFIVQTALLMSFLLYAPSLALNVVTGFDLWASVIAVGAVVTLYTALGGMKAVIWTDTFQAGIIVAGLLAVLIQGSIKVGGFQKAWDIAGNRSRINFHDFSFNPSTRHSFWSVVVGGGLFWMSLYGVNQSQVQRAMSCPTVTKAQIALLANLLGMLFIVSLCSMIGIVMFAFYSDCHPLDFNGLVNKRDQLLPLFVMDILGHIPGVPGVFLSCIISGSLSSLSSGLNGLAAVIPVDLIQPYCCKKISDRHLTFLSKAIVIIFGVLGIALSYLVSQLGNILQAIYSIYSIINGPMFGMFVLGMFFPWANAWGAFVGGITSLAFMCWIGFGAFVNRVSTARYSPTNTSGCNWNITTTTTLTTTAVTTMTPTTTTAASSDPFLPMYSLSYLYYTPTAMAVLIVVGMVVSLITGKQDPASLDPRLICPLFDRLFPCMPECILRPLRCGISYNKKYVVQGNTKSPHKLDPAYLEASVTVGDDDLPEKTRLSSFDPGEKETFNPGFDPKQIEICNSSLAHNHETTAMIYDPVD